MKDHILNYFSVDCWQLHKRVLFFDFWTVWTIPDRGYAQINKELIVTNNDSGYTYVFNFESKLWTKLSQSWSLLINSYPNLYGITESGSDLQIRNISDEAKTGCVE